MKMSLDMSGCLIYSPVGLDLQVGPFVVRAIRPPDLKVGRYGWI
jgi:hypothetical protein